MCVGQRWQHATEPGGPTPTGQPCSPAPCWLLRGTTGNSALHYTSHGQAGRRPLESATAGGQGPQGPQGPRHSGRTYDRQGDTNLPNLRANRQQCRRKQTHTGTHTSRTRMQARAPSQARQTGCTQGATHYHTIAVPAADGGATYQHHLCAATLPAHSTHRMQANST